MSWGSYVYGKGRSSIGHLIAIPNDSLPALRPHQTCIQINQTRPEIQILLRVRRLPSTSYLHIRSYYVVSKPEGTQQVQHGCTTLRPTGTEHKWLLPMDNQPTASPTKRYQHVSTAISRAPHPVPTLEPPDQTPLEELREQSRSIPQGDSLKRRLQHHRELKDLKKDFWRKNFTRSRDWQLPLSLLKRHYKAKHKELTVLGLHRAHWPNTRVIIRQVRATQIPRPQIWSVTRFRDYVEALTSSTVDRLVQRKIYRGKGSHVEAVANILDQLFRDTGMRSFLSIEACNIVLQFFYKHRMLPKARALVTHMEHLYPKLEPETFDIILRGSAACNDIGNYTYHLQNMIKRGCKPSPKTWTSLLMAVDSSKARKSIVQAMQERKLLKKSSIMRDVVQLTIRNDVANHLDDCEGMGAFFAAMDTRYAPGWLTVSAANAILDEVGIRQSAREAFELLEEISKRVSRLDQVTLNTLLSHCSHIRAHDLAIDVLDSFEVRHGIIPTQKEYEVLFKQAWRGRLYNFAKVVWRSACMDATMTFPMYKLVWKSLTFEMPDRPNLGPKSRANIWKAAAGKVVVGAGLAAKAHIDHEAPCLSTTLPEPMQNLNERTENIAAQSNHLTDNTKTPKQRPQLIPFTKLLKNDLEAFGKYRMERKLAPLLREALAMDRQWAKGNWRDVSTEWKCRNSIVVGVQPAGLVHDGIVRRCEYDP